jgi:hypothetical protein
MALASSDPALAVLESLVQTAVTLLRQLEAVVNEIANARDGELIPSRSNPTTSINALSLAHDSASLIKAHSTKISLFIINNPFTPTAITKVLKELVAGPIPGLASAVQACDPSLYTSLARHDLAWRSYTVLKELRELLQRIPKDGKVLSSEQKNGSAVAGGKGSIAATGTLWAACDEVARFSKLGVAAHFVRKTEELRDTLKDVMEELKEWGEDDGEDAEDQFDDTADDAGSGPTDSHASAQAMLDNLMNSHRIIPPDDPDNIRERLDSCLKRLRLTTLLYTAIIKRRLKKLPSLPSEKLSAIPQRLDEVAHILKKIPDLFCDLAGAFYELRPIDIDRLMDQCFFDAFAASELLAKSWDGQRDEFTEWAEKFQVEIKKD